MPHLTLYTKAEAGRRLGVSRRTVDRLVENGRLRVVNVSTGTTRPRFRIREDDLDAFIEDNTHVHPAAEEAAS